MIENKKILIISMSAWNSKVGSDTWPTLMEGLNPDNIANIALRDEVPDSLACNNYFVISENRVLKSIFKRKIKTGKRVEREDSNDNQSDDLKAHNLRYQKMSKRRGFFTLLAREIVWKVGKWKTKELNSFMEEFKPDVILYFMDGYIHLNRICKYAKKKTGAKTIGFFVDDTFTFKQSNKLGTKLFRIFQRRSLKKLAKKTDAFWALSDMTKKEADQTFKVCCTVVTKPLKRDAEWSDWEVNKPIKMLYTGNMQIGRDRSLLKVVNAVKNLNKENRNFEIEAYTKTFLDESIKKQLECDFCKINGAVPQQQVFELQKQADILLFLEDVDGPDAKTARLSFSTKITDYLSSGRSILAIGNLDTSPMQYFIQNDCAMIATSQEEIEKILSQVIINPSMLKDCAKSACECGIKNHKKENILNTVHQSIEQLFKDTK